MKKVARTAGVVAALILAAGTSAYAAGGQLSGESISATGVISIETNTRDLRLWESLQAIIFKQLGKGVKMEDKFVDDLGADSLDMVEICMMCEEKFEIVIPEEDLELFIFVCNLYDYIAPRIEWK